MMFAVFAIFVQVFLLILLISILNFESTLVALVVFIADAAAVFSIFGQNTSSSLKMPWIYVILVFPVAGLVFYLLVGHNKQTKKMRKRYEDIDEKLLPLLHSNETTEKALKDKFPYIYNIARYLKTNAGYPTYQNTDIEYYSDAADGLEAQKAELKKAEKFIFMEYHAIQDAESWHGIQDILAEKAAAGVDVRVFYDDMGSIGFVNTDFVKRLEDKGIKAKVFNPFAPGVNLFLNNRDHRKITVIDGKVGFTGGYNLANEYFHIGEPFGFWKDTGIRLEGDAVESLTITFLEMWNAVNDKDVNDTDYKQYLPKYDYKSKENGFIVPYADSPMDDIHVGEDVYMSVAESAKDYAWFITPYLIITDEMIHALSLAAKKGVDVRVITPGIPDKKIVYSVTRSYYNSLARNGVKIYEFTPGFCHCKMCVSDDIVATCGTINMDYRSLYHHFENGCLYADCDAVMKTKEDFIDVMKQSKDVTEYYTSGRGAFLRLGQLILRIFAPLM
ncbi:MAG: cardiolipin synthase [Lachnospiraceae bacterium]|nr:cardiolipin synthase [Lachnospiraceae bacterium]